jgi:hypothetical protein
VVTEVVTPSSPVISTVLEKVSPPFNEIPKDYDDKNKITQPTQQELGASENNFAEQTTFPAQGGDGGDSMAATKQQQGLDTVTTSVTTSVTTPVTTSVTTSQITKGSRVRVHCPGSKRDGKEGVVTFIKKQDGVNIAVVNVKDVEANLKVWECPLPSTMLEVIL